MRLFYPLKAPSGENQIDNLTELNGLIDSKRSSENTCAFKMISTVNIRVPVTEIGLWKGTAKMTLWYWGPSPFFFHIMMTHPILFRHQMVICDHQMG